MQGYVIRKRDRYYAVIYDGLDPVTGRARRSWHPAGNSFTGAKPSSEWVSGCAALDERGFALTDRSVDQMLLDQRWNTIARQPDDRPPARHQRVPTAGDTPATDAASSLVCPVVIAAQNRRRSSRCAAGGRPGDRRGTRPDRSECRFRFFIATSFVRVLRRPLESAQYAAGAYQKRLAEHGIVCSMSRKGNCWDNAPMESFFHTLKTELVHHRDYLTRDDARRDIFEYIEVFYNRQRRHSTLGYLSPAQFEVTALAA